MDLSRGELSEGGQAHTLPIIIIHLRIRVSLERQVECDLFPCYSFGDAHQRTNFLTQFLSLSSEMS